MPKYFPFVTLLLFAQKLILSKKTTGGRNVAIDRFCNGSPVYFLERNKLTENVGFKYLDGNVCVFL